MEVRKLKFSISSSTFWFERKLLYFDLGVCFWSDGWMNSCVDLGSVLSVLLVRWIDVGSALFLSGTLIAVWSMRRKFGWNVSVLSV